jgi:MinD-like ATPase involved in chromosome partitioning or flagellar assembly
MKPNLRIVTLTGDPENEATVASALSARRDVELVLRCVDRIELLAGLRSGAVDAIVAVGAPPWFDRQGAAEARRAGIRVIGVVGNSVDAERLADLGAALVPANATADEVIERCRTAEAEIVPPFSVAAGGPSGRLIALWGPKGAPGRTTLAIELAASLAATEPATLLIDGDPYGGDMVQLLGVAEELASVVWAARVAARDDLDAGRMTLDFRRVGANGPVLLPGLTRPELWADVSEAGWRALLNVARASFRNIVCDVGFCLEPEAPPGHGSGGRNRMTRIAVGSADHVVAVCSAEPIGVKNFLWSFDELCGLAGEDRISIVANRVRRGTEKEVGDLIRRHLGRRPSAYIPDRPADTARAVMDAQPVLRAAPRSDVGAAVRGLAASLGGAVRPRGLLTRLAGGA